MTNATEIPEMAWFLRYLLYYGVESHLVKDKYNLVRICQIIFLDSMYLNVFIYNKHELSLTLKFIII